MKKAELKEILLELECELYDSQLRWSEYMLKREVLLLVAKRLNITL